MGSKTPRCVICKKKTLLGITCSCGSYLCIPHRDPSSHSCPQLNKTLNIKKEQLKQKLVDGSVITPKIEKI